MLSQCPNRLPHSRRDRASTLLSPPGGWPGRLQPAARRWKGQLGMPGAVLKQAARPCSGPVPPSARPALRLLCFCFGPLPQIPSRAPTTPRSPGLLAGTPWRWLSVPEVGPRCLRTPPRSNTSVRGGRAQAGCAPGRAAQRAEAPPGKVPLHGTDRQARWAACVPLGITPTCESLKNKQTRRLGVLNVEV